MSDDLAEPSEGCSAGATSPAHMPVMVDDVLAALGPLDGRLVVDGTFGAGGYSRAFLARGARVIGIDRDPTAHEMATAGGLADTPALHLVRASFGSMDEVVEEDTADAVVLDVGVSSMQIDRAERGFSFMRDGPLDMRMSDTGPTAAEIVAELSQSDLTRVIGILGEERNASRISRAVVTAREAEPIQTTAQLARIVEKAVPRRPNDRIHPATRTFQAIRIFVNDELGELARGLVAAERCLKAGGTLAVVTFHSLEDRIVKRFLAERSGGSRPSRHMPSLAHDDDAATFELVGKQGRGPSEGEIMRNPRSRSAKLRVGKRTGAASRDAVPSVGHDLPPLSRFGGAAR